MNEPMFSGDLVFLSNFYPSKVWLFGLEYPTVEHAYQAAKSPNYDVWVAIKNARTPGDAKKIGRTVDLRKDWEENKNVIMRFLLRQKFTNYDPFTKLVNTRPMELIETNYWHDNYWGACMCKGCEIQHKKNVLGKLLMELRSNLCRVMGI